VAVVACTLAACSGGSSSSHTVGPSATTSPTSAAAPAGACGTPHASGQTSESFIFQGKSRTYQLYVPESYTGSQRVPLVFNFHAYGSNAIEQMIYGDFKPLADRDGFLIVAPDGQGDDRHFNLLGEPGLQDDIAMVRALLDHVESGLCVDTKRVYATGMSDGGAMTSALACVGSDKFAAFGAVAVIVYPAGCASKTSVAITAFSGTADPIVPFNGGTVHCCGGQVVGAAPGAMAQWAAHDGCGSTFSETRLGSEVRERTWTGCKGSGTVVFYIIDGGGHTWPGAIPTQVYGRTTRQIDATQTIWAFFKAHQLS
jgi:polyhydroxybutyrate depolymerase